MATPPAASRSSSRWGIALLQKAVEGVESRLDDILADEDTKEVQPRPRTDTDAARQPDPVDVIGFTTSVGRSTADGSRRASTAAGQPDRLQERLARALNARNSAITSEKPSVISAQPSPTGSGSRISFTPRISLDSKQEATATTILKDDAPPEIFPMSNKNTEVGHSSTRTPTEAELDVPMHTFATSKTGFEAQTDSRSKAETFRKPHLPNGTFQAANGSATIPDANHSENLLAKIRTDDESYVSAEIRREEEIDYYLERIDALQAKVTYLTNEATVAAKKAASDTESGKSEKIIAAKDERIALLTEEGQKLSQTELQHYTMLQRLRAKAMEEEKRYLDLKIQMEEQGRDILQAYDSAKRAEEVEQQASEKSQAIQTLNRRVESLSKDNKYKEAIISDMAKQVANARATSDLEEMKRYRSQFETEKALAQGLRDDISAMITEQQLTDERYKLQVREVHEKFNAERERARMREIELQTEIRVLESRLESFRERIEEASSGSVSDTQAKLLRQIETLQTQYSVAGENWQGIEDSLLARITGLETDRDAIAKRESDLRRKARELSNIVRRQEKEVEDTSSAMESLKRDLEVCNLKLADANESLHKAEKNLGYLRSEMETERAIFKEKLSFHISNENREERENRESTPEGPSPPIRMERSPIPSQRRRFNTERVSPHGRKQQTLHGLGLSENSTPVSERALSRRSSTQRIPQRSFMQPLKHDLVDSQVQESCAIGLLETSSEYAETHDDYFEGVQTPISPERTVNDVISASTAGAGPSVQLVERMSATVRKLETEKAASKEETSRLSAQRDEAIHQVVSLLREAEEKKAADDKISFLEAEVNKINQRYQTTLEMLGEKSELVEELKADVADVKQMYRELINDTMR